MKTKNSRKFMLAACLTVCVALCSVLGSAFIPSASAEEIKTYDAAEDVTETIEASSFSEGATYESEKGVQFEYSAEYGGFVAVGFTDECSEAYTPDTLTVSVSEKDYTYPVVRIEDEAFKGNWSTYNKNITYVRVGKYIEYVGVSAFYICEYVTQVDYYAEDAVAGATSSYSTSPFGYVGNAIKSLDIFIGDTVEVVPDGMFSYIFCSSITFAEGSRLKKIGDRAFYNMYYSTSSYIPEIRIPDTVESVGASAFYSNYVEVKALYIPENLTEVGKWAFAMSNVDVLYFNAKAFPECDKNLAPFYGLSSGQWNLNGRWESGKSGTTVYIGRNVTRIPEYCFYGSMSASAKAGAYISSVYPDCCASGGSDDGGYALESIGSYAFSNCGKLSEVVLPMGLETIEAYAFDGCSSLTSVTLGDTDGWYVTDSAGTKADGSVQYYFGKEFMSEPSTVAKYLRSMYIDYCFNYSDGFSYELSGDGSYFTVSAYTGDGGAVTIPETHKGLPVKEIASSVFEGHTEITSITIPENITTIGDYAFFGCTYVTSIFFNATSMNDLAQYNGVFYNTGNSGSGITVTVGAGVTRIPAYLFDPYDSTSYRPYIKTVVFESGSKCTEIGDRAFSYCNKLTTITLPEGVITLGSYSVSGCSALTSFVIPSTVTTIKNNAFGGDTALTCVTIPESVTYLGDQAFYNCKALTEINYNVADLGDLSFGNHMFSYAGQSGSGVTVTIGACVTRIPAYLFYPTTKDGYTPKILSVVFEDGSGCEEVGEYAFYGLDGLTSLYVGDLASYLAIDFAERYANPLSVVSANGGTFYVDESKTTELTAKNTSGVTRIGSYALAYCTIISDVVIVDTVKTIGEYALYGNTSVNSVTIPSSVTEIGAYAFGSMSLKSLTLESSSGWTATNGSTSKTFQASELQQGNALTYLTSTYVSYVWTRKAVTTVAPTIDCAIEDYGYTNGSIFIATGVDAECTILCIYYTDPNGTTDYVESSTLTLSDGLIEGMYEFWAVDSEMSESERYHVTYDTTAPEIYAAGSDVWVGYVGSGFSVYAKDFDDLSPVTLYYSRDGESWTSCGGDSYSVTPSGDSGNDGEYWFAARDAAGNTVGAYGIVLDTLTPDGEWGFTDNFSLYFTWDAPSYTTWTCTVNGESYIKGTTYRDETTYVVVLTSPNNKSFTDSKTLGHKWGDGEYIEPTCQEDGYWKYTCVYCGRTETVVDEFSSSGEHNYELELVEPTCTESGYSQYVCTDCEAKTGYTYYAALGHLWSNSDVSIPANCTENGYIGQVCTRDGCGAYNELGEIIPASGHDFVSDDDFYLEPTCEEKGRSRTVCTKCGEYGETVYTNALGHSFVTESRVATCTEYAYTRTYCTRTGCGYEEIAAGDNILAAHSWSSEPYELVSATCEGDGYIVYVCEVCGEKETVTIGATGHNWVYIGETTVTDGGGEESVAWLYQCSKCGDTKVESVTDAKETGNAVTELFEKYQKYIWWILLALVVIWSLFIGLRWVLARNDQEKVKARSMLGNYILGLFVIALIVVGLPYLVYGIALLAG